MWCYPVEIEYKLHMNTFSPDLKQVKLLLILYLIQTYKIPAFQYKLEQLYHIVVHTSHIPSA